MERAARNGERLHLEVFEVRAIVESDMYPILQEAARQELIATWKREDASDETGTISMGSSDPIDP